MLAASGYPGMKIMQFAFDRREPGNYLPYTYPHNSVVYTGTHDNVTTEAGSRLPPPRMWPTPAVTCAARRAPSLSHDLRLPRQCFGYGNHPFRRLASSGRGGPHQHPQHPGCQLAVAAGPALPDGLDGHIAELTRLYDRAPA